MSVSVSENADLSGFSFYEEIDVKFSEFTDTDELLRCIDFKDADRCLRTIALVNTLASNRSVTLSYFLYRDNEIIERLEYSIDHVL